MFRTLTLSAVTAFGLATTRIGLSPLVLLRLGGLDLGLLVEAHGQADTLALHIHFHHLDLDHVTGLDHCMGIADKLVRQ